ncbi:MAG: PQQ-dependent dehydrogenase, methanol/ethanol family, partial [Alphaproteobacteria bacterium]|nr:PQQ-dependent dehydrogenase, methanol/ethanol family [Alphaproteobacteria bacterium]
MTLGMKHSASLLAIASGISGAAFANDDVLKLSKDPANVVMPSITYNGQNFSTLDQIKTDNVKNLQVAWTWQVG